MSEHEPPANDGIYRAILLVMVATIVIGAVLAIAGETALENPALSRFGTGVALVGAAIYAFFRFLGLRETKRRARADEPPGDAGGPGA